MAAKFKSPLERDCTHPQASQVQVEPNEHHYPSSARFYLHMIVTFLPWSIPIHFTSGNLLCLILPPWTAALNRYLGSIHQEWVNWHSTTSSQLTWSIQHANRTCWSRLWLALSDHSSTDCYTGSAYTDKYAHAPSLPTSSCLRRWSFIASKLCRIWDSWQYASCDFIDTRALSRLGPKSPSRSNACRVLFCSPQSNSI